MLHHLVIVIVVQNANVVGINTAAAVAAAATTTKALSTCKVDVKFCPFSRWSSKVAKSPQWSAVSIGWYDYILWNFVYFEITSITS